jgi:hypothetical protein
MSVSSVQHILDMIDQLSTIDREILEQQIVERAETEWRKEAEQARLQAKTSGLDQDAIDEAIHKCRYGR